MKMIKNENLTLENVLDEISFTLHNNFGEKLDTLESFEAEYKETTPKFLPYFEDSLKSYALIESISYREHPDYDLLFRPFDIGMNESISQFLPIDKDALSDSLFLRTFSLYFEETIPTMDAYYAWIEKENVSESTKYRLLLLGTSRELLIQKYQEFMKQFEGVAKTIQKTMAPKVKSYIQSVDPEVFVEQSKEIGMDLSGYEEIRLGGFAIGQNALRIIDDGELEAMKSIKVMIGIKVFDVWELRKAQGLQKESVLKKTKMLSDPTKLEILLFCQHQERYGKELAAHLDLSEATISHHMQQLLAELLVSVRVEKNRTYYKTTTQTIEETLKELEIMFGLTRA